MRLAIIWFLISMQSELFGASSSLHQKFRSLQDLVPGTAEQNKVSEVFGKPTKVTSPKDMSGAGEAGALWEYFEGDGARLSILFETQGKRVRGWTWSVNEEDREADPKVALDLFPGAKWVAEMPKWANPHQVPMECFFRDEAKGITLEYSRVKKLVTSISWWNPARKLSSTENEKPPRFCIDNFCSESRLSTEVYKDHPLCELPK